MPLPELTERFLQVIGHKRAEAQQSPRLIPPVAGGYAKIEPFQKALQSDRPLTVEERAIAGWLLLHAEPPALDFLPQLEAARVAGGCTCGCPTIDLAMEADPLPAEANGFVVNEAIGEVSGNMVGILLFQRGGYLSCLEFYDLSDIEHPYGLPAYESLRPLGPSSG